jgi:hypothetical protein
MREVEEEDQRDTALACIRDEHVVSSGVEPRPRVAGSRSGPRNAATAGCGWARRSRDGGARWVRRALGAEAAPPWGRGAGSQPARARLLRA